MSPSAFPDLVVKRHLATDIEISALRAQCKDDAFAILMLLVQRQPNKQAALSRTWGDALDVAYVDTSRTLVQPEALARIPEAFAREHVVLPLYMLEGVMTIAASHPEDPALVRKLENLVEGFVSLVFDLPDSIETALDIAYMNSSKMARAAALLGAVMASAETMSPEELKRLVDNKATIEFCRGLIGYALHERASDIHLEPTEDQVRIRLRVDGALRQYLALQRDSLPPLVNRFKIMAGVDIAENRLPQDGRISIALPRRALDIRFASMPTMYGETVVLRLLGQNTMQALPSLEGCGFARAIYDGMQNIIRAPNGIFFLTGPTGSGKTTTLYAALATIATRDINIVTIEDPVEYILEGINQSQVNPAAGLTFASALRAFLRQDPNVIFVGEVRDPETAGIAIQAALTGHLVLTTLHTNNALQAVTRLIQIGVEPYLVAPTILGAMAQRLVRQLCPLCARAYTLSNADVERYFLRDDPAPVRLHRAVGCANCAGTGYRGRLAIHELLMMTEDLRERIARNESYTNLLKAVLANGYVTTMRYDGLKKALRGLTTIEEIDRATWAVEQDDPG